MCSEHVGSLGRMALVHEWLQSRSGSEKTFEQMSATFPDADLVALTENPDVEFQFGRPVRTTALQRSRILAERRHLSLPLMPFAWSAMRKGNYDVVLSSSHAFARYFRAPGAVHLSYVYTPLRYAWLPGVDGRGDSRLLGPARWSLRVADRRSVAKVASFAAISNVVRERIERFYGRSATVIFPPVDVEFFGSNQGAERGEFVLGVSRWIDYKRLDLVIAAAEHARLPVVIAGGGPLRSQLEHQARAASVPVRIVHDPSDDELRRLYQGAAAVVFPAEEDFGIVPVEAQAAGARVVALRRGGSLDTVLDGVTGVLVDEQDAQDFATGIRRALELPSPDFASHVAQFSIEAFHNNLRSWVNSNL